MNKIIEKILRIKKQNGNKYVYLTIDDCPSKNFKEKIDFLKSKKIPAILFCTGKGMLKYEKEVIYAIKKGFIIGNHAYSHPHFSLITLNQAEKQIKLTDEIIAKLYKKAKIKRKYKVFRFPYGDSGIKLNKKKIQAILKKYNYSLPKFENMNYKWYHFYHDERIDIFWTYDVLEYKIKTIKKTIQYLTRTGGSLNNFSSRDIILIHDHARTTKRFYKIINSLIERNIKFVLPEIK